MTSTKAYSYIRFSTPDQAAGDSLRRQKALIDRYVEERGLDLQESEAFSDLGVSSFRGDNLEQGLGRFLEQVRAGQVPTGSVLLVESVDRLSRQKPVEAMSLLLGLVKAGITVVSLADSGIREFNSDAGLVELIMATGVVARAHEESSLKSARLRAAWQRKRDVAASKPVTSLGPRWLKLAGDRAGFELIEHRAQVVRRIFELAAQGWGQGRIAKLLNQEQVPSFGPAANGWHTSSIAKILSSRGAIGCYQPHQSVLGPDGRMTRQPIGDEVKNYYPAVVSEELFYLVQHRREVLAKPITGRQGEQLSNLFTGLAYCGWCGSSMTLVNKGKPPKGNRYLACSAAQRGRGCKYRTWPYDHLEAMILAYTKQVDYAAVLGGSGLSEQMRSVEHQEALLHEELLRAKTTVSNLEETILAQQGRLSPTLSRLLADTEQRLSGLTEQLQATQAEKQRLHTRAADPKAFSEALLGTLDEIASAEPARRYELRMRIRSQLSQILRRIDVRPRTADELRTPSLHRTADLHFTDGSTLLLIAIGDSAAVPVRTPPK